MDARGLGAAFGAALGLFHPLLLMVSGIMAEPLRCIVSA